MRQGIFSEEQWIAPASAAETHNMLYAQQNQGTKKALIERQHQLQTPAMEFASKNQDVDIKPFFPEKTKEKKKVDGFIKNEGTKWGKKENYHKNKQRLQRDYFHFQEPILESREESEARITQGHQQRAPKSN